MSGVRGLSWLAAADANGAMIAAGSGIATGRTPRRANIRWHAGDRVTLHAEFDGNDVGPCSGGYAFFAVRDAG